MVFRTVSSVFLTLLHLLLCLSMATHNFKVPELPLGTDVTIFWYSLSLSTLQHKLTETLIVINKLEKSQRMSRVQCPIIQETTTTPCGGGTKRANEMIHNQNAQIKENTRKEGRKRERKDKTREGEKEKKKC